MKRMNFDVMKQSNTVEELAVDEREMDIDMDFIKASLEDNTSKFMSMANSIGRSIDKMINSSTDLMNTVIEGVRARKQANLKWTRLNKKVELPTDSFSTYIGTLTEVVSNMNDLVQGIEKGMANTAIDDIDKFIKDRMNEKMSTISSWKKSDLFSTPIDSQLDDISKMVEDSKRYIKTINKIKRSLSAIKTIENSELSETIPVTAFISTVKHALVDCDTQYRKIMHNAIKVLNRMVVNNE